MLERIREGAQGPIVRVILFLIILAFAFTGVNAYLGGSPDTYVAKVNGHEITETEFERAYRNQRAQMEEQLGDFFDTLAADPDYMRQFRADVLEQLIEEQLSVQFATRLGLQQGDAAVRELIRNMPEFQGATNQFDREVFERQLFNAGFTPESFREYMRGQLNRMTLLQGSLGSEFALPGEVEQLQKLQNERRSGRYLTLSAVDYAADVEVSESAIEDYYYDNEAQFEQEERLQVNYVRLNYADVLAEIEIPEAEVRAYYEDNPAAFRQQERRSIAHILVEFGDDEQAARARIEAIQERLEAGEDFAELAATESDDTFSGEEGGDLGRLEEGSIDPDIEEAGFALTEAGEVSDVVRSEFGFHLIKLTEYQPEDTTPFAEVEQDIRENLASAEAERVYFERQQDLAQLTFEHETSLDIAADELNLEIHTSPWLQRNDLPEAYDDPAFVAEAFSEDVLELGVNSDLIELDESTLVVRRAAYEPAEVQPLADVREQIESQLQQQEAQQRAMAAAEEKIAALRDGTELDDEFTTIESVTRFGGDLNAAVREELFRMPAPSEGPTYATTGLQGGDVALLELREVTPGIPDPEMQQESAEQLEGQQAERLFRALMSALKEDADIDRNM